MLVSVNGCSLSSTVSLSLSTYRCISSASTYLFWSLSTVARLFILWRACISRKHASLVGMHLPWACISRRHASPVGMHLPSLERNAQPGARLPSLSQQRHTCARNEVKSFRLISTMHKPFMLSNDSTIWSYQHIRPKCVLVPVWKAVHEMRSDLALESSTNNKDKICKSLAISL
jgi:hypothetical protein